MLAVALTLLSAGCTPEARRQGEGLTVLVSGEPEEIDPRRVHESHGLRLSRLLFASLVTMDPQTLEAIPDLAETVEIVDPVRYRVTLRSGLKFGDGSELGPEDVLATFRSAADHDLSRYARTYARIARMTVEPPRTILFELDAPHATFLTDLELPILRAEDERQIVGLEEPASVIGAGPYRLARVSRGSVWLEANPHWHSGVPRFPSVRLLVIRDDNTRALRLQADAGDLVINAMPSLLVPIFDRKDGFEVRSAPGIGTTYLGLNTEVPVLSDPRVRRALAYAIDREALIEAKYGGRARLARGWVPPGHWAYEPDVDTYGYDPARARALLREAGVAQSASPLRFTLRTTTEGHRISTARAIAAMMGAVGVEVDVRPTEKGTLLAELNRGRFQMTLLTMPELFEPHLLSWFFSSDRIPGDGVSGGANRWRLKSPELDAALERGRAHTQREVRLEAYGQVQRILARELPVIPLWHEDVVAVLGPRARGFRVPRDGRLGPLAR